MGPERLCAGLCTDERGELDRPLLRAITGMQNGRGMIAEADFEQLMRLCTDEHSRLDRVLLRAITGMQTGRGMITEADFERLIRLCSDEHGQLDRTLLRAITGMQGSRGMIAEADFERLMRLCKDEHGQFDRTLLQGISSMQNGRGMISEVDFEQIMRLCTDEHGQLDRVLLRAITSMQNGKGMITEVEFERAMALRDEIRHMAERGDFGDYANNAGQIRFAQERANSGTVRLRPSFSVLDADWRTALSWSLIDLPLERAVRVLDLLKAQVAGAGHGPIAPVIDGQKPRVAIDTQGQVVDWFGTDGLPRRLQQFSGRLVGFATTMHDQMPMLMLRLKAPLGYAVYSFSTYLRDPTEPAPLEIVVRDGIPESFVLWDQGHARTIRANHALLLRERPEVATQSIGHDEFELEAVAQGPSVADRAEQQVLAITLQSVLAARYGQDEAERIVTVFSEFDAWTQDEGLTEEDAYARLADEFGMSEADYAGYKRALRELLSSHGMGASGFTTEEPPASIEF